MQKDKEIDSILYDSSHEDVEQGAARWTKLNRVTETQTPTEEMMSSGKSTMRGAETLEEVVQKFEKEDRK